MDFQNKSPLSTSSDVCYKYNAGNSGRNQNRNVNSIVNELNLPINLLKSKLHAQSSPTFERLVLDTHVSTSSTIMAKPREETIDNNVNLLSATSQSSIFDQTREDINTNEEMAVTSSSPFDLFWCFGFNPEVPILSLSNKNSSKIVFANSQYAVLYDFLAENMTFIQGHLNTVSCMSVNATGSIIATADSGSEAGTSRVIVCDERSCVLHVLDNVHPYGCQQIGLGFNGDFLVTVSANENPVCFKVWQLGKDRNHASVSVTIKEPLHNVKKLTMNAFSKREFALTFERGVIFATVIFRTSISMEEKAREKLTNCVYDISAHYPSKLGSLTDTTYFDDGKAFALSSTCKGYVVVWEDSFSSEHKKNYTKYVRLHLDCITSVQMVDNKIAVATASGNVSFYDFNLKILYSYKSLREPIVSISFNLTDGNAIGHHNNSHISGDKPGKFVNAILKNDQFSARDFVVSTENGRIAYFNVSSETYNYLLFPSKELFTALEMLPNSKFLCAGTDSGKCMLFDTDECKVKVLQQIKVATNLCQAISFLKYSPSGYILACGMYTGDIWLLDPLFLRPKFEFPLTGCNFCITEMLFSSDSKYLIITDVSFCVSVYCLEDRPTIIGQYIAHFKPIVQIKIIRGTDIEDKELFFFTVSRDRSISVFKIDKVNKIFDLIYNRRVTQHAEPMYSIYWSSAGLYMGVNNEHKFRLHDPPTICKEAWPTVRCRGTFLAPDFGSPIDYMDVLENNGQSYLFFKSKHHIGIHILPVDGNPYRALGFRASPTEITCCRVHPNGKYVFTISKLCSGISMWRINTQAVDEFYKSGGEGLEPFLRILGKEKENDIREFFELGQFLHQGESPTQYRTLKNSLPICEAANVLQALGCIMTKQDVQEINEFISKDLQYANIEYEDFVRLYFNYRKTEYLKIKELRQAFRNFYTGVYFPSHNHETLRIQSDPVFDSATFIKMLEVKGEEFSQEELFADFSILTGGQPELLTDEKLAWQIPPTMPKEISFETFVNDILGFDVGQSEFE